MTKTKCAPDRAEFDKLWSAWREARERELDFLELLKAKYFFAAVPASWANRSERAKLDRLSARAMTLGEKCYRWLEEYSPRDWRAYVPVGWVCNELRYEDAVTDGPLSVVPMPAYGCTAANMRWFAGPVEDR